MSLEDWKKVGNTTIHTKDGEKIPGVMVNVKNWVCSDHILIANNTHRIDIVNWIDENDILAIICYNIGSVMHVYFANETDAMAFKLRWVN